MFGRGKTFGWLQVELLAKKVLNNPVEIQVGGRSVVNPDIEQKVEVSPDLVNPELLILHT